MIDYKTSHHIYFCLVLRYLLTDKHIPSLKIDSSSEGTNLEENLLESVLATLICKDEVMSGRAFLEANNSLESCQRLLKMWKRLVFSSLTSMLPLHLCWLMEIFGACN